MPIKNDDFPYWGGGVVVVVVVAVAVAVAVAANSTTEFSPRLSPEDLGPNNSWKSVDLDGFGAPFSKNSF